MKTFLLFIATMFAFISVQAQVARYGSTALATGLAIVAGGGTSNTVGSAGVMDCRKSQYVALQIAVTPTTSGANATNLAQLIFHRSVDGLTYSTYEPWTLNIAVPSTTQVVCVTNYNIGGAGWLKLASLTYLSASGTLTNNGVVYSSKTASP